METVETETKNRCVIEATHVLRRKLRKIKFYRLKTLITLEQVNTTEWSKENANESCDERAIYFRRGLK